MRTWGRAGYPDGSRGPWVEVSTDANGLNDAVMVTTLAQTLQLNLGESPFFANYGIPAHPAVIQQIFPDFYVARTQQQFSGFFAALTVAKLAGRTPHYRINVTTQLGAKISMAIPI